uniref:Beta-1,4-N-acetylgalactosaminyltransferase n=1 Tax=Acrobeloides nanus TaxID=290746 RepID=A0A914DZJ8_9BILA
MLLCHAVRFSYYVDWVQALVNLSNLSSRSASTYKSSEDILLANSNGNINRHVQSSSSSSVNLLNTSSEYNLSLPEPVSLSNQPLVFDVLQMESDKISEEKSTSNLPLCPDIPDIKDLDGHLGQATLLIEDLSEDEVHASYPFAQPGGHWKPAHCQARHKVAIIIPYRDRQSHLIRLLDFLVPMLKKQLLDYRFIVTEQYGDDLFNKGRIMNAAFRLAEKLKVNCVVFHDVDMFPQDDRTPYSCPLTPRHVGAFVSNLGYQLWYKEIVGGVLAINMDDYRSVNGYSNMYWAWGGEDDDMGKRILSQNYTIERPNSDYVRFSMLKHVKRKRTAPKLIYKLLDSADTRWVTDGLNETGKWDIKKVIIKPLYYHIFVDVGKPPDEWRAES